MGEAHELPISEWVQVFFKRLIVNNLVERDFTKSRCQSYRECQKCLPVDRIRARSIRLKMAVLRSHTSHKTARQSASDDNFRVAIRPERAWRREYQAFASLFRTFICNALVMGGIASRSDPEQPQQITQSHAEQEANG